MKKSEFIKEYIRRLELRVSGSHPCPFRDAALEAAEGAEEAGVQWDPEERELPGRIGYEIGGNGTVPLLTVPDESGSRFATEEEYQEAVACYNFVRRLEAEAHLNGCGDYSVAYVRKLLREERAKLS